MSSFKKVAVVCGSSLSDGLMMMVASQRLLLEGYDVVTFHDHLHELVSWFTPHMFSSRPQRDKFCDCFADFDLVIFQYDASSYMKDLVQQCVKKSFPHCSIFYPFYSKITHPPLSPFDRVFNKKLSMVDNIAYAISSLLQMYDVSKSNGLKAPQDLKHRRYKRRVTLLQDGYLEKKYQKIIKNLEKKGFEPYLVDINNLDLEKGARILYESSYCIGPECDFCHLASNLHIPTLVVSGNKKPLILRTPGWLQSVFITPSKWMPWTFRKLIRSAKISRAFFRLVQKEKIYSFPG